MTYEEFVKEYGEEIMQDFEDANLEEFYETYMIFKEGCDEEELDS